jgi:phosphoribosylformylglycinamidine synthase
VSFNEIGKFSGKKIQFTVGEKSIVDLGVEKTQKIWLNSLKDLVLRG